MRNNQNVQMKFFATFLVAMSVLLMATPSRAEVLTFTNLVAWQSALDSAATLEDFESATTDVLFGLAYQPTISPNGELWLQANANFDNNASVDVAPFSSSGAGINGNVAINLRFFDQGNNTNSQESVIVTLPAGISAFAFEYNNYDNQSDGTFLSFAGTNGQTVAEFNATSDGFFGVIDTGVAATISSFAFTADPSTGTGTSAFNSFDDIRYGTGAPPALIGVPEPTSVALLCVLGFVAFTLRRKNSD